MFWYYPIFLLSKTMCYYLVSYLAIVVLVDTFTIQQKTWLFTNVLYVTFPCDQFEFHCENRAVVWRRFNKYFSSELLQNRFWNKQSNFRFIKDVQAKFNVLKSDHFLILIHANAVVGDVDFKLLVNLGDIGKATAFGTDVTLEYYNVYSAILLCKL